MEGIIIALHHPDAHICRRSFQRTTLRGFIQEGIQQDVFTFNYKNEYPVFRDPYEDDICLSFGLAFDFLGMILINDYPIISLWYYEQLDLASRRLASCCSM